MSLLLAAIDRVATLQAPSNRSESEDGTQTRRVRVFAEKCIGS